MRTEPMDPYEVLGVSRDATAKEVKKAYRELAMKYHPDRHPDRADAEERFKQISRAYQILRDPEKREAYHRNTTTSRGASRQRSGSDVFEEAFGNFQNMFDLFNSVFRDDGPDTRDDQKAGRDVEVDVSVTLEEVAHGATKQVRVPTIARCGTCNGSGAADQTDFTECSKCSGTGTVKVEKKILSLEEQCPTCEGTGRVPVDPCSQCGGTGEVEGEEIVEIQVPAGVGNGQTLRWRGQGAPGEAGGRRGDLMVIVTYEAHDTFETDGLDVKCQLPTPFTIAALGGTVEVPTLDGPVEMKVPSGTESGKVFRLENKGLPELNSDKRGDQYAELVISTPQDLTARQEELLREYGRRRGVGTDTERESGLVERLKNLIGVD